MKTKLKNAVTRIVRSKRLNAGKLAQLSELAKRLSVVRKHVWNKYGSVNGAEKSAYDARNEMQSVGHDFNVTRRMWQATTLDVMRNIAAYRAACKVEVKKAIFKRTDDKDEQKRLFTVLKSDQWASDRYLSRKMRKAYCHGQTSVANQIALDSQCYTWSAPGWLSVMSLVKGKRIAIPLASNRQIRGNIRLIINPDGVAVHHTVEAELGRPCGTRTIGIDKGYTEAFVDSDGDFHGKGLGKLLSAQSDRNKIVYQARNKLFQIAKESSPAKRSRIVKNNLGRKKLDKRKTRHDAAVNKSIYTAVHRVVDKAKLIGVEDLTAVIKSNKRIGKDGKRRLSGWVKGLMAEAITNVSHRRCSSVHLVCSAYSSQECRNCGCLGKRSGDVFHCDICRVDTQADWNAAGTVLNRISDPEIDRYMPYRKVKQLLLARTAHRVGLLTPDPSCGAVPSTGSELHALFSRPKLWAGKHEQDQGDADAQYNLGVLYSKGWGVPQDRAESVKWYRKAAHRGDATAQYNFAFVNPRLRRPAGRRPLLGEGRKRMKYALVNRGDTNDT